MHPRIEALGKRIRQQTEEMTVLLEEVDDETFHRPPAPDRWCIGQHLAHIALVVGPYARSLEEALEKARHPRSREKGRRSDGSAFRTSWLGQAFLGVLRPPPKRRVKTFGIMKPPAEGDAVDRTEAEEAFVREQEALRGVLEAGDGWDLGRISLSSPFVPLPLPRFRFHEAAEAAVVHTDRHIWLMRECLGQIGHRPGGKGRRASPPS